MNVDPKPECGLPVPLNFTLTNYSNLERAVPYLYLALTIIILMIWSIFETKEQILILPDQNLRPGQISLYPLIQIYSWGNAVVGLIALSMTNLSRGLNVVLYVPLFILIVNQLLANRYLDEALKRVFVDSTSRRYVISGVFILSSLYLVMMPTILKSDRLLMGILSFTWGP